MDGFYMLKFILVLSLLMSSYTHAASLHSDIKKSFKSDVIKDLFQHQTFDPPYSTMKPLELLQESCTINLWNVNKKQRSIARVMMKQEVITSSIDLSNFLTEPSSGLSTIVLNSGGVSSFNNYAHGDVAYLFTLNERGVDISHEILNEHNKSNDIARLQKELFSSDKEELKQFAICLQVDLLYSSLGGNGLSRPIYRDVYNQVKREQRKQLNKEINDLSL